MKKIATLLKEGELSVPPDSKVIKAEDFSTLLTALEIIPVTKKDAQEYKEECVRESELAKEQAEKEGFDSGLEKWAGQLAYLESQIHDLKTGFESQIFPIAMAIAKKVVGHEIEQNAGVVGIVKSTLKNVVLHKRITLYVHKDDLPLLEEKKEELKTPFEELQAFAITERDDVERGGCIIETEQGIIDARLSRVWEVLQERFAQLFEVQTQEEVDQEPPLEEQEAEAESPPPEEATSPVEQEEEEEEKNDG